MLMNRRLRYRYALSVTSQFYFCGVPFRLDTTPKCTLNCLYCFAMSRGGRRTSNRLVADFDSIARKLDSALQCNREDIDINGELLAQKVPIHFGGISDPFPDSVISVTSRRMLRLLHMHRYPVIISTKNTRELLRDESVDILKEMKCVAVQVSITTSNRKLASQIEPNVPSPRERIRCIDNLSKEGIHTVVRLQPLFLPWLNEIVEELIPMLACAGCKHVVVEYLKLPVERNISLVNDMYRITGWDAYEFYKENGAQLIGREWILPNAFKWENLQPVINAIRECGMTYGSGDYGLNHLGDTRCCCGIDHLPGFEKWFRGNFANVIRHSRNQYLYFPEVEKHWFPKRSINMFMNSNCRLTKRNDMLSYLRQKWNAPGTVNAPDSFLGVSWRGDYDSQGNCVYVKEKTL